MKINWLRDKLLSVTAYFTLPDNKVKPVASLSNHSVTSDTAAPIAPAVGINIATFCDSAIDDNGKLSLLGAFDTIHSHQFPAIHPRCSLAIRLNFARDQFGKHIVKVRFLCSDGNVFFQDVNLQTVARSLLPDDFATTNNLIVNIEKLQLPKQGLYFIEIWLDDRLFTKLHLFAKVSQKKTP